MVRCAQMLRSHWRPLALGWPVQHQRLAVSRKARPYYSEIDLAEVLTRRGETLDLIVEEIDLAVKVAIGSVSNLAYLRQGHLVAKHLEDHPVLVASQLPARRLADRERLAADTALEARIALGGLAEAAIELGVRRMPKAVRKAILG